VELRPADLVLTTSVIGLRGPLPDAQIHPGEPLTYRLAVSNKDLATARDVRLAAVIPDALHPGSARSDRPITPTQGGPPGLIDAPPEGHARYDWRLPRIGPGEEVVVDVPGRVDRDQVSWSGYDSLFVRAAVDSVTAEASPADERRGDVAAVYATDLFVNLDLVPEASGLRPGGQAVYDITLGNNQRQTQAFDVVLTGTIPAAARFDHWQSVGVSGTFHEIGPFDPEATQLVWGFDGAFGLSQGVRVWLDIDPEAGPDTVLRTAATVSSGVFDVQRENNSRSHTVRLVGVNLTALAEGPAEASPGDQLTYQLTARNSSQSEFATGVRLESRPPTGVRLLGLGGGALQPDGSIMWSVGELAAGGERSYAISVEVSEAVPIGSILGNEVRVLGDQADTFEEDNTVTAETRIVSGPPAALELAVDAPTLQACGQQGATITADVRDRFGHPVTDGTAVSWTAQGGEVAAERSTTRNGRATNIFSAGRLPGLATVNAEAGPARGAADITLVPGPVRSLNVSAFPSIVSRGGTSTITVHALDACANAVADGTSVALRAARGTFAGQADAVQGSTRQGRVDVDLRVGTILGPLRVTAESGDAQGETMLAVSGTPATPTPDPTGARHRLFFPFALDVPATSRGPSL
jgi:hypothetical protein